MDTLDALRLFIGIAEAGTLSAAARQQSVATSTVTVALQQLETQAGARLITRSTRRLSFTYEGRQFLADARRLLADWDASIGGVKDAAVAGEARLTSERLHTAFIGFAVVLVIGCIGGLSSFHFLGESQSPEQKANSSERRSR
jgi:DNA-binding transcriptional LysR family regulator